MVYYIKEYTFHKEHMILDFGDTVSNLYLVEEGFVKIYNKIQAPPKPKPGEAKNLRGAELIDQFIKKPVNKEDALYEVGVVDVGDSIGEEFIMSDHPCYFRAVVKSAKCTILCFSIQDLKMCLPNCIDDYRWFAKMCKERKFRHMHTEKGNFLEQNIKSKPYQVIVNKVVEPEKTDNTFKSKVLPQFVRVTRIVPINQLFVKNHGLDSGRSVEEDLERLLHDKPMSSSKSKAKAHSFRLHSAPRPATSQTNTMTITQASFSPKNGPLLTTVNLNHENISSAVKLSAGKIDTTRGRGSVKISAFFDGKKEPSTSAALPSSGSRSRFENNQGFLVRAKLNTQSSYRNKDSVKTEPNQIPGLDAEPNSPGGELFPSPMSARLTLDERIKSQLVKALSHQTQDSPGFLHYPVRINTLSARTSLKHSAPFLKRRSCYPAMTFTQPSDKI